jgi:hypothetical protein
MVSNSLSFIGRAIAPMAVVLAIGFAAPAQAAPLSVEQLPTTVNTQTDVTRVAWHGRRHDGNRHYGYRHHRRGLDGLDIFGAVVGGALLSDDRYDDRYYSGYDDNYDDSYDNSYDNSYYTRRHYYHSRRGNWAPTGWPRS